MRSSRSAVLIFLLVCLSVVLGVLQSNAKKHVEGGAETESAPNPDARIDPVTRAVQFVILPPTRALNRTFDFAGDTVVSFLEAGTLRRRVEELETTLSQTLADRRKLEALERENWRLRQLQEMPPYPQYQKITADIVALNLSNHRITLNVGEKQGVKPGAPVLVPSGLVGQVVEVSKGTCVANLVTHPRFAVGARVFRSDSQEVGILRGRGSDQLALTIYREPTGSLDPIIRGGDEITTSGLSMLYPEGILIGRVAEARRNRTTGVIEATVVPAVNLAKVREVVVLVKK